MEDEEEYTRTVDFEGGKALENCQKLRSECVFTFFGGNRFLVSLVGQYVNADELKKAAKSLRF
jgi:hypothetical protein